MTPGFRWHGKASGSGGVEVRGLTTGFQLPLPLASDLQLTERKSTLMIISNMYETLKTQTTASTTSSTFNVIALREGIMHRPGVFVNDIDARDNSQMRNATCYGIACFRCTGSDSLSSLPRTSDDPPSLAPAPRLVPQVSDKLLVGHASWLPSSCAG